MSKIPKVGLHIIALLILTCLASFGANMANRWRVSRQEMVALPGHFDVDQFRWQGVDCPPPVGDAERDHPPSLNRVFQLGTQAPVFVSIARVNTLNGLRSPASYLMDTDGRIMPGDKLLIRPNGEWHVHYVMEIAQGHDSTILLIHWVQAPGQPAFSDFASVPRSAAKGLLFHSTFYSCDVWVPLRSDSNGAFIRKTLIRFANDIEGQIRTGHLPVETNSVLPVPSEVDANTPTITVPSPPISPIPATGIPSPVSPTPLGSSPESISGDGAAPFPNPTRTPGPGQ
jgi:hypothetical protein